MVWGFVIFQGKGPQRTFSNKEIWIEILLIIFQQHPITKISFQKSGTPAVVLGVGIGHVGNFLHILMTEPFVRLSARQPPEGTIVELLVGGALG